MVALARNLNLARSRFFTGLTAVFVARLHQAPARQVRAFVLLVCRHDRSPCCCYIARQNIEFLTTYVSSLNQATFPP
jgi:hypothetical protein